MEVVKKSQQSGTVGVKATAKWLLELKLQLKKKKKENFSFNKQIFLTWKSEQLLVFM